MTEADLAERAAAVLDRNWLGRATKPAPDLYPHQWSWDSAFIAIGNRYRRWDRAAIELESLFAAQWANGLVPHIVFGDDDPDYFPSGSFWRSDLSPHCPPGLASSGVGQPPVHATAARLVYEAGPGDDARRFASALWPKLDAWHRYLHRERAVDGALIEVWHPWESGRDNNPEWDQPMAEIVVPPGALAPYRRADTRHTDAADRPSNDEYDVYLYLIEQLKDVAYGPADPRGLPFRVRDVVYNAVLVRAERDLADLGEAIGIDGTEARARADRLEEAIHAELWSPATGLYHSMDARTGQLLPTRTSGAFTPLLAGPLPPERIDPLLTALHEHFLVPVGDRGHVPLTVPATEAGFDAGRYWRGPTWINLCWLIARGLEGQGQRELATRVRTGSVELCRRVGFYEYFDPRRLTGHGSDNFSWSAALTLDVLSTDLR